MGMSFMRKNKIFREWLRKAEEDFGFANASLKETKYYSQFIGEIVKFLVEIFCSPQCVHPQIPLCRFL